MAKGKGFDPVADANELAEHNINPYYWVNKVTSYTYARWMAEKKVAIFTLPMYLVFWGALIWGFADVSATRHVSIVHLLFDFTDNAGSALAGWVALGFMAFYTVVVFIMAFQLIFMREPKPHIHHAHHDKQRSQPKHRKDYH